MSTLLSRFLRTPIVRTLVFGGLALTVGYALAQQMMGPRTTPHTPAQAEGQKKSGGYKPERMKNPNVFPHAARMTITPPAEIPLDRIKLPKGFQVEIWAHGMPGVRMMTRGSKGTIWAGTRVIGRVYEIKDKGGMRTHRILAEKLVQPNGVAFQGGNLYVMAINRVFRYDGIEDNPNVKPVELTAQFKLPPEVHHNWKFIAFGPDSKLYVQVGSPCNICEPSPEHGQIRRYIADGSGMEVVARGVRNSVGFDFHPQTGQLWFTDNGRDWMGDNGPQDELNRVSKIGQFFGFPYCHAQGVADLDFPKKDACKGVTLPVALMGPHAGALGMRFYTGSMFPKEYVNSIFVARRGSWNRDKLFAFDVANVRATADGKNAKVTPFMTGFMDPKANQFWGRPVDVLQLPDGSLLVSDEQNGAIYRVSYKK
ncbi:MAG TPA: PQQ-dependent sugar dehydrogenase [Burkholderiales bacterium]|nr:PQQ-dependent sugar dehydrogenase [Burkholderiales bacterium]